MAPHQGQEIDISNGSPTTANFSKCRAFISLAVDAQGKVSVKIDRIEWVRPADASERSTMDFLNIEDPAELDEAADFPGSTTAAAPPAGASGDSSDQSEFDYGSVCSSPAAYIKPARRFQRGRLRAKSAASSDGSASSDSDSDSADSTTRGSGSGNDSGDGDTSVESGPCIDVSSSDGGLDADSDDDGSGGSGGSGAEDFSVGSDRDSDASSSDRDGGASSSDEASDDSTAAVVDQPMTPVKRTSTAEFSTPEKKRAAPTVTPVRPAKAAAPARRPGRKPAPKRRND